MTKFVLAPALCLPTNKVTTYNKPPSVSSIFLFGTNFCWMICNCFFLYIPCPAFAGEEDKGSSKTGKLFRYRQSH